ncbi:MAG: winged helix-turn-helix transcriptional regulator [Euryarchaeota archaeon]|nr:winged helix-turn-helix transcriptional regulator [Euryarchaeota archaeon]
MDSLRRLLWWMLAGSSGGRNRGRIIVLLRDRPSNAHQIAKELGLDYKTVRHHLDVMMDNQLLTARGEGYGRMYFLSPMLDTNYQVFSEIRAQIGKTQIRATPDGDAR